MNEVYIPAQGENEALDIYISMLKKPEEEQREILKKAHIVKKKADLIGYKDDDLELLFDIEKLLEFLGTDTEAKEALIKNLEGRYSKSEHMFNTIKLIKDEDTKGISQHLGN